MCVTQLRKEKPNLLPLIHESLSHQLISEARCVRPAVDDAPAPPVEILKLSSIYGFFPAVIHRVFNSFCGQMADFPCYL
jgi:hypothetical protein